MLYIIGGVIAISLLICGGSTFWYWVVMTPEERAAHKAEMEKERRAEEKAQREKVTKAVDRLGEIGRALPSKQTLRDAGEKNCPAGWNFNDVEDAPFAGVRFYLQFTSDTLRPSYPFEQAELYTDDTYDPLQDSLDESVDPTKWDAADLESENEDILDSRYFVALYPTETKKPKIGDDRTFLSGIYNGWVLIVDRENPEDHCFGYVTAYSSVEVSDSILGDESALEGDFIDNFEDARERTYRRILGGNARSGMDELKLIQKNSEELP